MGEIVMERTWLLAWEFYAFMALAGWLVYTQFVGPWLRRGRQPGDAAKPGEDPVDPAGPDGH